MPVARRASHQGPSVVFVTTTVRDWLPAFLDGKCASIAAGELYTTALLFRSSLLGYVVMPSHVRAILGLPDYAKLSNFMKCYKAVTARKLELTLKEGSPAFRLPPEYHLWMRRFDDLIIWSEKQLLFKLNYIHNNPVKNGLCDKPEDWMFSSATDWLRGESGPVPVSKDWPWFT